MCPLGVSERVEKQCARPIRANVTARAASPRLCHRSSSRVETDALAHPPGVVRRPAGIAVVRHHLHPSPICRRLPGTCREANALSCSYSERNNSVVRCFCVLGGCRSGSCGRTEFLYHCTDPRLASPCSSSISLLLVIGYVFISFCIFCVRRWSSRFYFIDALSITRGGPACDQTGAA